MMSTKDKIEKLNEYTKAELVHGVVRCVHGIEYDILINQLEAGRTREVMVEQEKADEAETEALNALLEWRKEMTEKYGDVGSIKSKYTADERQRGINLEIAWNKAQEKCQKLEAKFKKMMNI